MPSQVIDRAYYVFTFLLCFESKELKYLKKRILTLTNPPVSLYRLICAPVSIPKDRIRSPTDLYASEHILLYNYNNYKV